MQLPFTHDQFLDVFAAFNTALWPLVLLLWMVTLSVIVAWARDGERRSPLVASLLAFHWAWSGVAYHFAFFRHINQAAGMFGLFFVVQAIGFLWFGVVRGTLRWRLQPSWRGWVGGALILYGLLYPVLNLALGLRYPRMPAFGVPCPTTLVTAGVLLTALPGSPRAINFIPIAWCAVAGSAALTLGIRVDLALWVAGVLLLVDMFIPRQRDKNAQRGRVSAERSVEV